jgi:NodT family efflux transporter outer membrane factor (OMF) lipoprotein
MKNPKRFAAIFSIALLAGCMVGPDYQKPDAPAAPAFKELAGWKPATPLDAIDRAAWWSAYNDPLLDRLERQIDVSSQTLRQSEAAYRAAAASVGVARASLFPLLGLSAGTTQQNNSFGGVSGVGGGARISNSIEAAASWDADVWGRLKRLLESSVATAQISAADLANARLSIQIALATDYLALRGADELQRLLDQTVVEYEHSLQITQNQYRSGVAARADVITAQTLLESTRAQAINVGVARGQFEHAIAVLAGLPPSALSIPPGPLASEIPLPPPSIPSTLLERRPDIAAAERAMAAQNALIGVQIAAYYPDISLSALYGYVGNPLASLIQASNRVWSLGANAGQTLFSAGARPAAVAAAEANYDQAVAAYRQTVLTAFQQVEDALSTSRILQDQAVVEARAVALARQAVTISLNEYRAGTVAYTAVITAQATALADEQAEISVHAQRLQASVALIGALGGGWSTQDLVGAQTIIDSNPLYP